MFNLGGMEILVILVVALLVLGPNKLPQFMRTLGKAFGEFRRTSAEFKHALQVDIEGDAPSSATNTTPRSEISLTPPNDPETTLPRASTDAANPVSTTRRCPRAARVRRIRSGKDTEQV